MTEEQGDADQTQPQIVVVGPDGQPVAIAPGVLVPRGDASSEGDATPSVTELVEQPAKVMRIGTMVKQLLDETRSAPLDEAGRARLRDIHQRSVKELEEGLAPELVQELERLSLPFSDQAVPSEAELRIAQAQLVGWLEGLFHGIQTALFAQQMAARAQFEDLRRRALTGGQGGPALPGGPLVVGDDVPPDRQGGRSGSGPYL